MIHVKPFLIASTLIGLINSKAKCQIVDIDYYQHRSGFVNDTLTVPEGKNVQVLKSGYVDFLTDGNIQASARLLRINIGERDKFYLPFYVYTGTTGNAFGTSKLNQTTISNLLNPIGGTVNLSFNGLQNIIKGEGVTKLKFAYQFGGRIINGRDSLAQKNLNFFNGLGNVGFFFQTEAWTPDSPESQGVFYVQANLSSSISSEADLKQVFGESVVADNYFYGYSVDAGIEINRVIAVKLGVYKYVNNKNISLLKTPIVKFSLDYSLRK